MKNIINHIKYYLFFILFPFDLINLVFFGIFWAITFDRQKIYDIYGNVDRDGIIKDAINYFHSKREIMKHLRIIYLLIILAIFCL